MEEPIDFTVLILSSAPPVEHGADQARFAEDLVSSGEGIEYTSIEGTRYGPSNYFNWPGDNRGKISYDSENQRANEFRDVDGDVRLIYCEPPFLHDPG